jgi:hypothetical protein
VGVVQHIYAFWDTCTLLNAYTLIFLTLALSRSRTGGEAKIKAPFLMCSLQKTR